MMMIMEKKGKRCLKTDETVYAAKEEPGELCTVAKRDTTTDVMTSQAI